MNLLHQIFVWSIKGTADKAGTCFWYLTLSTGSICW